MKTALILRSRNMSTGSGTNHVLSVLVWLFGIFVVFWGCYGIYQEHEQEQKTEQYRSTLTPISRAEFDRQQGTLQAALDDLSAVNPDSPDHEKAQIEAQSLKREIQTQIENQKTPLFETGKDNCKARVKDQEEFPSTVEFKWFGTDSTVDKTARQITVTVDYTAQNSMGAELPYRMTCDTNYDGEVTKTSRTGR